MYPRRYNVWWALCPLVWPFLLIGVIGIGIIALVDITFDILLNR